MSVFFQEARSFTKNSGNAPALMIGLPVRKRSPVDFWMALYQLMPPLNTKIGYMVVKGAEPGVKDGKLPAEARNDILEAALAREADFVFFLDDDVLFPDITLYRMWVMMQKYPQVACTTAVGCTKLTPTEPLIYADGLQGAYWDWQLGAMTPIHSAWAGCMLVNMDYVRKVKGPWFNDVVTSNEPEGHERVKRNVWGQDRYFHKRLREETGGLIMADTGVLVAHYDADLQKAYILPPDAPCFKSNILGESFVTFIDDDGLVNWRRIVVPDMPNHTFNDYLAWLQRNSSDPGEPTIAMVPTSAPAPSNESPSEPSVPDADRVVKEEQRDGYVLKDSRKVGDSDGFAEWFKALKGETGV